MLQTRTLHLPFRHLIYTLTREAGEGDQASLGDTHTHKQQVLPPPAQSVCLQSGSSPTNEQHRITL